MDTLVWGPLLWPVLFDVIKFCNVQGVETAALLSSLKRVLPCVYCRRSYRFFYTVRRPPAGRNRGRTREELFLWVHWLKDRVSRKLDIQSQEKERSGKNRKTNHTDPDDEGGCRLSAEKFLKRAETWRCFGSVNALWDVLYIVAANYPVDAVLIAQENRAGTTSADAKKTDESGKADGYRVFLTAIGRLLQDIPYGAEASRSLQRGLKLNGPLDESDLAGRDALMSALHGCAVESGFETESLEAVVSRIRGASAHPQQIQSITTP